eukprot:CAMPEP_0182466700 /NCGR_PEP_ID=MMETSP1319-20130603/12519_1 /TAXON_ID=172717 /ORGANISM="Bolidomonas pacifica, Strain RCC208" /LENGTH=120 /DNA_ID=CAMNT_0024666727 /DNA_START=297 /DNA_END=657 /DNA_ORIENTATION=-
MNPIAAHPKSSAPGTADVELGIATDLQPAILVLEAHQGYAPQGPDEHPSGDARAPRQLPLRHHRQHHRALVRDLVPHGRALSPLNLIFLPASLMILVDIPLLCMKLPVLLINKACVKLGM